MEDEFPNPFVLVVFLYFEEMMRPKYKYRVWSYKFMIILPVFGALSYIKIKFGAEFSYSLILVIILTLNIFDN